MLVQTDDANVSITFIILFVIKIFDRDKRFKLIERDVNVSIMYCSHNFVVLSTNLYKN